MDCNQPVTIWPHRSIDWIDAGGIEKAVQVPCGKCIPCLMNKRLDWSFRLEQEFKYSTAAWFITLTYDQRHCPSDGSLDKTHCQKYLKRLRKLDGTNKLRYFLVGEYGGDSGRPHYHLLLFNLCNVDHARKAWSDSKGKPVGIVHIGSVSPASVAYCTKYIVQPDLAIKGLQKPFSLMSRGYGIGAKYLSDAMIQWHKSGDKNYVLKDRVKGRLPRYYREKIWFVPRDRDALTHVGKAIVQESIRDRERISAAGMALSLENQALRNAWFVENYGDDADRKLKEFRNALFARVKIKVAFTQSL